MTIHANYFDAFNSIIQKIRLLDDTQCDYIINHVETTIPELVSTSFGDNVNFIITLDRIEIFDNLYDLIQDFIQQTNDSHHKFKIEGFEPIKYHMCTPKENMKLHVDYACDLYNSGLERKLCFIINLNNDYEGGAFEFLQADGSYVATSNNRGDAILFASFIPYRMQKITKGYKKFLLGWIYGPPFS